MPTTKRVITTGGLGNQLFQLCFALFLHQSGVKIIVKPTIISPINVGYQLGGLKKIFPCIDIRNTKQINHYSLFGRAMLRSGLAEIAANCIHNDKSWSVISEKINRSHRFNNEYQKNLGSKVCFHGWWQHYKYTLPIRQNFIDGISSYIKSSIVLKDSELFEKPYGIIHVRRGDFLSDSGPNSLGVIHPDSYNTVLSSSLVLNSNIPFFVLSDDPFLSGNRSYNFSSNSIIDSSRMTAWELLKIMSEAKVLISSNSTLSYWGAVMVLSNNGTALLPKKFYKGIETHDAHEFPGIRRYDNKFI